MLICVPDVTQLYDCRKPHNIWHFFLTPPMFTSPFHCIGNYICPIHTLGKGLKRHDAFLASPFLRTPYTTKTATFLLKDRKLISFFLCIWNLREQFDLIKHTWACMCYIHVFKALSIAALIHEKNKQNKCVCDSIRFYSVLYFCH